MARRRRQAKEPEEELPSEDEVQLFHRDRSKRLVEASRNGLDERSRRRAAVSDSDESSEEEESEVEEVIGLTGTAEDEDDEDDEDDENAEDAEEEEDDGDDDDDSDDDDSDEDSDDEQDPHATKGWGVSKKNFYSGEEADSSDSDAEDGTDALAEEEAEARRLQRQRSQKLHTDDFGDVSGSDDEETLGATAASGGRRASARAKASRGRRLGRTGSGAWRMAQRWRNFPRTSVR